MESVDLELKISRFTLALQCKEEKLRQRFAHDDQDMHPRRRKKASYMTCMRMHSAFRGDIL